MKTKAITGLRMMTIFVLIIWANTSSGQTGCLYSTHFDRNGPKTVIGGWHNYKTEVKDSQLRMTLDGTKGNQWYNWSVEYRDYNGTAVPIDFSIPENIPVVRFRARATDTVSLSVALIDKDGKILGGSEVSLIGIVDLTTEYQNVEMDFSGLFYNEWNSTVLDSSAITGIVFLANPGYIDFPYTNSFGQTINKPFDGIIEFDWIGTGLDCHLPENYLSFSVPDKICKDSLVVLTSFSGNFVNAPEVVLTPGQDGEIVSEDENEYVLRYSSTGEKTIELSFSEEGIASSYTEVVKVKDCSPGHFDQKVVGYISSYGDASGIQYALLTHAMFAFLNVKPDGSIDAFEEFQQNNFEKFLTATSKTNTKRLISIRGSALPLIPGWTGIEEVAKSADAIHHFADTIVKFCLHHHIHGVDMDWEGLSTSLERDRYTQLMDTLERHLHAAGLQLVATLPFNAIWGQWFADAALKKADWLQIMVYDATGTWPESLFGNHSSFQHLTDSEFYWTGRGYKREQLVMGVPFYGYKFNSTAGGMGSPLAYKDIAALFPMMDDNMDQTPGNDLTVFNGPALLKKKCRYLKENDFGGVMIWEMTQDASGHKSLLNHMICALRDDIGCTEFKPCETGDITTGLAGKWDFDGNADDKSGNGNHASINSDELTHDRFGNSDNALISKGEFVNCGYDESLQLDEFTFSVWVNPSHMEAGKYMGILEKNRGCTFSYNLYLKWDQVFVTLGAGDKEYTFGSRTWLVPGNWYHIAVTHSYDNGTRIYINGLPDKHDSIKFHAAPHSRPHICGNDNFGFSSLYISDGGKFYKGKIDDVRIYNKELSPCDIDGLFYPYYSNEKVTGLFEKEEALSLKVYPNPSNGNYTIELPDNLKEGAVMTVTNSIGQLVGEYRLNSPVTEIQQDSEDGIYYLNISKDNKRYSGKIVISKVKK